MVNLQQLIAQAGMDPPGLAAVEQRIREAVVAEGEQAGDLGSYVLQAGGKRIRPALVLLSGTLRPNNLDQLVDLAVAVELIHMASLVHDDVIDRAEVRRGRHTINSVHGNRTAVLVGDYLFAKAFNLLSTQAVPRVLTLMTQVIGLMCEGEIQQASHIFNHCQTEDDYWERINKKTAQLISACCLASAWVIGADEQEADQMAQFGLNLGYAYQVVDDVLDFIGDQSTMGKPVCSDLAQGLVTLPLFPVLQHESHGPWLAERLSARRFDQEDLDLVCKMVQSTGAIEYAYRQARNRINSAKEYLRQIPSRHFQEIMGSMADMLCARVC